MKCAALLHGFDSTHGYLRGQIDPWTHEYKLGNKTWHRDDVFTDDKGHATDLICGEAGGEPQLFNFSSDPCETNDVAAQDTGRVKSMQQQLTQRKDMLPETKNK